MPPPDPVYPAPAGAAQVGATVPPTRLSSGRAPRPQKTPAKFGRALCKTLPCRAKARHLPAKDAEAVAGIEKKLTSHLGARVAVLHTAKKGRIVIEYRGNEDLQRLLEKLGIEA